eukprot:gene11789-24703_t
MIRDSDAYNIVNYSNMNSWLQSLRIPPKDSQKYSIKLIDLGFDDPLSVLEDASLSDLEELPMKPGHTKRIMNAKSKRTGEMTNKDYTPKVGSFWWNCNHPKLWGVEDCVKWLEWINIESRNIYIHLIRQKYVNGSILWNINSLNDISTIFPNIDFHTHQNFLQEIHKLKSIISNSSLVQTYNTGINSLIAGTGSDTDDNSSRRQPIIQTFREGRSKSLDEGNLYVPVPVALETTSETLPSSPTHNHNHTPCHSACHTPISGHKTATRTVTNTSINTAVLHRNRNGSVAQLSYESLYW